MAKVVYLLTYDLKLYTKPDIWDKEYKSYNEQTGYFEEIKKPEQLEINTIEVNIDIIKGLMKNVIHADSNILLAPNNLTWYLNFEKEAKNRPHLLENNELLFNYLVLKAMLAGVSESLAKMLFADYISKKMNQMEGLMAISDIIKVLDKYINQKIYWVPDISEEIQQECMLITDIIQTRSTSPDYNFEKFEARYLKLCNNGYTRKILRYNKDKSNLFARGLTFDEQREFLFRNFDENTDLLIEQLSDDYAYFKGNFASKQVLKNNMRRMLEYAMKFWNE